jgi:hypothetical protein
MLYYSVVGSCKTSLKQLGLSNLLTPPSPQKKRFYSSDTWLQDVVEEQLDELGLATNLPRFRDEFPKFSTHVASCHETVQLV